MPRPRLPPTPASSTEIVGKDNLIGGEMEGMFSLPPPALQSSGAGNRNDNKGTVTNEQLSPPLSPNDRQSGSYLRRKRTFSGTGKSNPEPTAALSKEAALPPPPSRARKIIQMKPRQNPSVASEEVAQSSNISKSSQKEPSAAAVPTTKRKQAQPSATSAAGRKIARKTAHSIIERRRRSKMNEEFGVLKDMIPACAGVDMHKLAILQAGIEYVRYLEGCIEQLKSQNKNSWSRQPTPIKKTIEYDEDEDDDEDEDEEEDDHESIDIDPNHHQPHHMTVSQSATASEPNTPSPAMTMKIPSLQTQLPLPPFQMTPVSNFGTNSVEASPKLQSIPSFSSLSTPSMHQQLVHSQLGSMTSTNPAKSTYSTSPPPISVQTPLQTGVSPAFAGFHLSPDLTRTSTWPSVNGQITQNKPSPNILPLPHAALPISLPFPPSPNYAATLPPLNLQNEGHAEATASAALLMMTRDRRGSVNMSRTSSGKGMSVKDLLSS